MIDRKDLRLIGFRLGNIVLGVGLMMLVPSAVAVAYKEWAILADFAISISVSCIIYFIARKLLYTNDTMQHKHSMAVIAMGWIVGMMIAAIPLWLSGSVNSYLDACFESMSGWTTTGLTLVPDIDHLSYSMNIWRDIMQFVGGCGIVIFTIAFLVRSGKGEVKMYLAEGRDERIYPNMRTTSRIIIGISLLYLLIGTILLSLVGWYEGLPFENAVYDAVCYTMAAFSTGGFVPHSQSMLFYHSTLFEVASVIIMVIGAFNFALHFAVLSGDRKEIYRNVEILTLTMTVVVLTIVTTSWLIHYNVYSGSVVLFRKGFYQLISAHTTAGLSTIYPLQMSKEWPSLPEFAITIAMLLGACACSTGGGFKALRVAITAKLFSREIKKTIYPRNAVIIEKYHHLTDTLLRDDYARGVLLVIIGYIVLFTLGTIITMLYDYNIVDSMFESSSAVANAGLSSGITSPSMPALLKVTYIFLMWAGRLEIMSVFTMVGILYVGMRKLKRRYSL